VVQRKEQRLPKPHVAGPTSESESCYPCGLLSVYVPDTLGRTSNNKLFSKDGIGDSHHQIAPFYETDVTEMSVA
jgi:hypothetical protein